MSFYPAKGGGGINLSKATKVYTDTGTALQQCTWTGATIGKTYLLYGLNQINTANKDNATGLNVLLRWTNNLGERGSTSPFPVFYIGTATATTIGLDCTRGMEIYQLD